MSKSITTPIFTTFSRISSKISLEIDIWSQNNRHKWEEDEMVKRTTDLTLTNRADFPEALELNRRVQIVRGSLQGSTGVIASYTSDEIYCIWRDCDPREPGCPPVPDVHSYVMNLSS